MYIVCKSTLFKITFELPIWHFYIGKVMRNIAYFLKTTFEMSLLFKVREQTAAFNIL